MSKRKGQAVTIRARINELQAAHGGLRPMSRAMSIDPGHLVRIKNGSKEPGPKVLTKLGLRKIVSYEYL